MKKIIIAVCLSLLALSASAQTLTANGGVGFNTNNIYRGETISNKGPSANGDVGAVVKFGDFLVFGNGKADSVSIPDTNLRAVARAEGGVGFDAWRVKLQTGVRQSMYFGATTTPQKTGVGYPAGDMNYREAFVRGAGNVLGGTASASYDWVISNPEGGKGHNSFTTIGYDYPIYAKTTVGATLNWRGYDTANTTRYNNTGINVKYALTKQVGIYAEASLGGKRADNSEVPNLISAGLRYAF